MSTMVLQSGTTGDFHAFYLFKLFKLFIINVYYFYVHNNIEINKENIAKNQRQHEQCKEKIKSKYLE